MRTTITLDPEVAALVQKAMRERNAPFKKVVNDAILDSLAPPDRPLIVLPTHSMGRSLVDLDKASQLAGELEDVEILRKMSLGK